MSTSSDSQTPSVTGETANQVITPSWDQFAALVKDQDRADFAEWLDDELFNLEQKLDRYATRRTRCSGRR